ncbi:hypothetical protein TrRE_jg6055 [Triparma retinervis]|uniref:Uncharacterized protein n=1 Tax=Triparma retinervis TaxID=2557542 RepID=A0A9W7CFG8_9STRA|nr:hypothetical protein TrRE_jg6055 [Triparma retinervis]
MADLDDLLDSISLDELEPSSKSSKSQNDSQNAHLDDLLDDVFDEQQAGKSAQAGKSGQAGKSADNNETTSKDNKNHPAVDTFHNICLQVLAKMNKLPPPACMNKVEGDYGLLIKKLGDFYGEELLVDGIKSKLEGESGLGEHSRKLMS